MIVTPSTTMFGEFWIRSTLAEPALRFRIVGHWAGSRAPGVAPVAW